MSGQVLLENKVIDPAAQARSVRLERTHKRVRCILGGTPIADSTATMLSLETGHLAVYYFPVQDVRADLLAPSGHAYVSPLKGRAHYYDIVTGARTRSDAAWEYEDALPGAEPDTRYIAFHWALMDAWFEEEEEVFVHPRDPYHRIDVLRSNRHVQVAVNGVVIAESRRPRMLLETGLPPRWYLPLDDVRLDRLQVSGSRTGCAYKGFTSRYWASMPSIAQ